MTMVVKHVALCEKVPFIWFLVVMIYMFGAMSASTTSPMAVAMTSPSLSLWEQTPGNITVFVNTTAVFNWTHRRIESVDITWYNVKLSAIIMSKKDGVAPWKANEYRERLEYIDYPGSAAVSLEEVTSSDEGVYAASLTTNDETVNHARLQVITAADIPFWVTMHGRTYNMSVANNGTNITLTDNNAARSTWYLIRVQTLHPAPIPLSIRIVQQLNGRISEEPLCERIQDCIRSVDLSAPDVDKTHPVSISIHIDFNIQNLELIHITEDIHLNPNSTEHPREKPDLACLCDPVWERSPGDVMVLAGTTAILTWKHPRHEDILISWYRINPRNNAEDYKMQVTKIGRTSKIDKRDHRFVYMDYPGSAAISLHNVGSADSGMYQARVKDLSTRVDKYDCSTANVSVIEASSMRYRVNIDGVFVNLSLAKDGPEVHLPSYTVLKPECFELSVDVTVSEPRPSPRIHIDVLQDGNKSNRTIYRHTCEDYKCSRYISRCMTPTENREVLVSIVLDFPIQNMNIIRVKRQILLQDPDGDTLKSGTTKIVACSAMWIVYSAISIRTIAGYIC